MSIRARVVKAVDRDWIADQAEHLVRVPSPTLNEYEACQLFLSQVRSLGLEVDIREVTPARSNLYARIKGSGGGSTLMLNGHLDTIPNQNNQPCYRDGDLIWGRGSTDMKGGLAAMLGAARALLSQGVQLNGDLLLTAVVGHELAEAGKDGPRALIQDINSGRCACDRIVIVEGSDVLWIMSMGSMVFHITLTSKSGGMHTQYVPLEQNPIRYLKDVLDRLIRFQRELDHGKVHPLAGAERIDVGIVRSGDYFNRTPANSSLTGTRRWASEKTAEEVLEELIHLINPVAQSGKLELEIRMDHEREPFEISPNDSIVEAVGKAHQHVTGQDARIVGMRIVGDANLYVHGTGVQTIYYGPSNETAHCDRENVSISRLESAAKVYALAAMDMCGIVGKSENWKGES